MTSAFYRSLLRLMPKSFRDEYGEEMCRVAEEHWRELRSERSRLESVLFWTRQAAALLREAARLRKREYDTMGGATMEGFVQDLKHAVRALMRRPGFTLVTVLTLGLGIGATTAVFSAVNTVLLRPLPYQDDERIVTVFQRDVRTEEREDGVSAANIQDFSSLTERLSSIAVAEPWSLDVQVDGRAQVLRTWAVSEGFFDAVGVEPALGRAFLPEEFADGMNPTVVLGHGMWMDRFGGDPAAVGNTLVTDAGPARVVGVMPSGFRYPDAADAWMARPIRPWDGTSRAAAFMAGVGRLAPGTTLDQAQAEADQIGRGLAEAYPDVNGDLGFQLVPLRTFLFGDVTTPLAVLAAAVGFVLLISCANVAGLLLARGAQREREFALRGALGAGTRRLMSHVTAESLVLACLGCVVGIALTYAGVSAIRALGADLPRIDELRVDGTVLLFAGMAAGLSAVLSGFAPSWRLSRPDLRDALCDGSRGSTGGARGIRLRSRLVVAEVAAAVVLLAGAGLLVRSFAVLLDKELGFEAEGRLAVQVFAYDGYADDDEDGLTVDAFTRQALDGMKAVPGVEAAAITTNLPGANDGVVASIDVEVPFILLDRDPPPAGQEPMVSISSMTPGYLDVMGIGIVEGRAFDEGDNADGTPVVIVNEALARRHFGDRSPIGQQLVLASGRARIPREIVGVARDTRPLGPASESRPEAMLPLAQAPNGSLTFVLEGAVDAASLTTPATEAIWAANPGQAVWGAATVESLLSDWVRGRRFILFLLTAFSSVALVLAAVGIYGLISFSVQLRLGELGVRRALGGQSGDLMRMVLGEGARLAGTGVVLGLVAAAYLTRFMATLLFEIEPTDPITFVVLTVLMLVIAGLATLVPAVRAMRVDPVVALRSE